MWNEDIIASIESHSVVFKNAEYYTLPALEDTDQFHVDYIKLAGIKYNEASITTKSGERGINVKDGYSVPSCKNLKYTTIDEKDYYNKINKENLNDNYSWYSTDYLDCFSCLRTN